MNCSQSPEPVSKICEKCGKTFGCEAETGKPCWCFEYSLSPKALEKLKAAYQQCLCPECLKAFSEGVS